MPAGLTVYNDAFTVQVDETYRNYGFRQIVPVGLSATGTSVANYQLVVPGEAALVACHATTLLPVMLHSDFDGANWTYNWQFWPPFTGPTYSETVLFYVFDVPYGSGFSNVGLEVFTAAGVRAFHSDMSPMKVAGIQQCNVGFFAGVSGRTYVPLICLNPARAEFTGSAYRHSTRCLRVAGSTIITQNLDLLSGSLGPFANEGLYAAIDVTGLS